MGLTPGCGGAIVTMLLYIRGTVSFGTVVATAGDSAFVILVLTPEAALYAYGISFGVAVAFGYAIDRWGLGVGLHLLWGPVFGLPEFGFGVLG